jgi:hypothetical protein
MTWWRIKLIAAQVVRTGGLRDQALCLLVSPWVMAAACANQAGWIRERNDSGLEKRAGAIASRDLRLGLIVGFAAALACMLVSHAEWGSGLLAPSGVGVAVGLSYVAARALEGSAFSAFLAASGLALTAGFLSVGSGRGLQAVAEPLSAVAVAGTPDDAPAALEVMAVSVAVLLALLCLSRGAVLLVRTERHAAIGASLLCAAGLAAIAAWALPSVRSASLLSALIPLALMWPASGPLLAPERTRIGSRLVVVSLIPLVLLGGWNLWALIA